jgi:hypothetical protein
MQKLVEGQVVRIKLNPIKFGNFKMASGTSDNMEKPKHVGMVNVVGNIGIAARWEVVFDGKRFPCGFYTETDAQGTPVFKPLKFNRGKDMFLYGGVPEHEQIYELLQVHPEYKNRISGPPSKMWTCELDIAEAVSSSEVDKFLLKNKTDNRVANLNQDELNILMSTAKYGMGFLSRPDALDNSTVARGIVLGELLKAGGYDKVGKFLDSVDKAKSIGVLHDIFANQKFVLMGKDLLDEKGNPIHSFKDSFKGTNHEEAAIWLAEKMGDNIAIKEAILAIKEQKKK